MKDEFYIQVMNCSLKFLSEIIMLCEVNVMLSVKMSGLFRFLLFYYFHSTRGTTR